MKKRDAMLVALEAEDRAKRSQASLEARLEEMSETLIVMQRHIDDLEYRTRLHTRRIEKLKKQVEGDVE